MITIEELKRLTKLYNTRPWQQEKHYIQHAILFSLAEQPLVFKGGTYLWFFHQIQRFSEDLDFTATGKISPTIMEKTLQTLNDLRIEATGKKSEGERPGISFRISAQGPLYHNPQSLTHVYVEISQRENIMLETIPHTLSNEIYGFSPKILQGMALEEVAAEKVRAIMSRNKPRDVFDLSFLIQQKKIAFNEKLINQKMKYYNEKFDPKKFIEKTEEKQKDWNREMTRIMLTKLPPFEEELKIIKEWIQG